MVRGHQKDRTTTHVSTPPLHPHERAHGQRENPTKEVEETKQKREKLQKETERAIPTRTTQPNQEKKRTGPTPFGSTKGAKGAKGAKGRPKELEQRQLGACKSENRLASSSVGGVKRLVVHKKQGKR